MARILCTSTLESLPWDASEELWSAAALHLAKGGHQVACCVSPSQAEHARMQPLKAAAIQVFPRQVHISRVTALWNRFAPQSRRMAQASPFQAALASFRPELVVLAQIGNGCVVPYGEECQAAGVAYACLFDSVPEAMFVPDDRSYPRFSKLYHAARKLWFLAEGNRITLERQLATKFEHASKVFAPCGAGELPWPEQNGGLKLACVSPVDFYAKGQDLVLDLLAQPKWRERGVHVDFYGIGPNTVLLQDLIRQKGLTSAAYAGPVPEDATKIWRDHHALILPSRHEGMSPALIAAAKSGRPAIVTIIGGSPEIVQEGVTGFIAEAPVVSALDTALERAWAAKDSLSAMGTKARERVNGLLPADPAAAFATELEGLLAKP